MTPAVVRIVRTPCHLGGSRPWFSCPVVSCGRRVAILYGGGIFACRHCHRLAYGSSREDMSDRTMRRADRLRERLGWESGIANGHGEKPKWNALADVRSVNGPARPVGSTVDGWMGVEARIVRVTGVAAELGRRVGGSNLFGLTILETAGAFLVRSRNDAGWGRVLYNLTHDGDRWRLSRARAAK